jgi:hypothetical protein
VGGVIPADTIRRYLEIPNPFTWRTEALAALDALVAEVQQQADRIAWLEGDVAGWRIKQADAEAEIKRLRGAA